MAFVKKPAARHRAVLQNCLAVVVQHKHIAVFLLERSGLLGAQLLAGHAHLFLEHQRDSGIAGTEVDAERPAENRGGGVSGRGAEINERTLVAQRP